MATKRDPRVAIAQPYRTKRVTRSPRHPHQVNFEPFTLCPFMIAPVLPGESLTNLILQNRVVTDPINAPLTGWWCEHWYFYVKHRDLAARDTFTGMMLNPAQSMAGVTTTSADLGWYFAGNGINWLKLCYERIVEEYFRDEGENWNASVNGPYARVQISGNSVLDSLTNGAAFVDRDVNVDLDGDGDVEASELDRAYSEWMAMRDAGLMDMDYEDFLRTYGVASRQEETSPELHRPELVRYSREWQYPTNTIDPTNGTPRSAVSWSTALRGDKRRFFKEPGFIVGLMTCRPKVFLSAQSGTFTSYLNNQKRWLPAVINDHPELSYMQFADNTGPLAVLSDTGGYWVDVRDLFVHGEQFTNLDLTLQSKVALPVSSGQRRYPTEADCRALFVSSDKVVVKSDGVTSLSILGRQVDSTPGTTL